MNREETIRNNAIDVRVYATEYNCLLQNSYDDWANEQPTEQWLLEGVANELNVIAYSGQEYSSEEIAEYNYTQFNDC